MILCLLLLYILPVTVLGLPTTVVAKLSAPLILRCPGGYGTWFHASNSTPTRVTRQIEVSGYHNSLVFSRVTTQSAGLYKCRSHDGLAESSDIDSDPWHYEVVVFSVDGTLPRRIRRSTSCAGRKEQHEIYRLRVGARETLDCGNDTSRDQFEWYRESEPLGDSNQTIEVTMDSNTSFYWCHSTSSGNREYFHFLKPQESSVTIRCTETEQDSRLFWWQVENENSRKVNKENCPRDSLCYARQRVNINGRFYLPLTFPVCENCLRKATFQCSSESAGNKPHVGECKMHVDITNMQSETPTTQTPTTQTASPSNANTPSTSNAVTPPTLSPTDIETPSTASPSGNTTGTFSSSPGISAALIGCVTAAFVAVAVIFIVVFALIYRRKLDFPKWDADQLGTPPLSPLDMNESYGSALGNPQGESKKHKAQKIGTISVKGIKLDGSCLLERCQITLLDTLGAGCFGLVMEGAATDFNGAKGTTKVAVKLPKARDERSEQELASEVSVWTAIGHHRNVIGLKGICYFDGPLWVVMEFAAYGSLNEYLRAKRFNRKPRRMAEEDPESDAKSYVPPDDQTALTTLQMFKYALDVAHGMEHLASKDCLHRDLAARNVLVCENEVLKVADFGMAKDIHYFDYYRKKTPNPLMPYKWTAPEALLHKVFTEASDVWSYGVLLWEIATLGSAPYPGVPSEKLYDLITKDGYRMRKPGTCSRKLYDMMLKTWALAPEERPKFKKLVGFIEKAIEESDGMSGKEWKGICESQSTPEDRSSSAYSQKSLLSAQDSGLIISSAPQESRDSNGS
eukprot:m.210083 g.210083  ORF g.210083 m.210083 type:complete len:797 (+) comp39741_c0_seq7:69-2459(+)